MRDQAEQDRNDSGRQISDSPTTSGTTKAGDEQQPVHSFAELGVPEPLLQALADLGYERPSQIQAATIPLLLEGRDVIGLAQTGTGKTAAFALPILASLELAGRREGDEIDGPKALVLSPTRELALQVSEAFESYAAHLGDVRLLPVYGGQGYGPQLAALRRGVDVVVGTPGRIMDHLERGRLDLSGLTHLVLDEADEMLNMGFADDVETILAKTPETKQVALFSATMPAQIKALSTRYLRSPAEVTVKAATKTNANIRQRGILVAHHQKLDSLTRILEVEDFQAVIVFVRTRTETEQVAEKLRARGLSASALNGDIPQQARERIIGQLREGTLDVLVATDVAARGLDVARVTHVINFDLPMDKEAYVHRIGRTGRAGRSGDAISLVTPRERRYLGAIEHSTGQRIEMVPLPSVADINESRLGRFDDAITAALEQTDRIAEFRDIIDHYVRHHDVPESEVAAALAVIGQGAEPLLLDAADEIDTPELWERKPNRSDRQPTGKGRSRRPSDGQGKSGGPAQHRTNGRHGKPERKQTQYRGERPATGGHRGESGRGERVDSRAERDGTYRRPDRMHNQDRAGAAQRVNQSGDGATRKREGDAQRRSFDRPGRDFEPSSDARTRRENGFDKANSGPKSSKQRPIVDKPQDSDRPANRPGKAKSGGKAGGKQRWDAATRKARRDRGGQARPSGGSAKQKPRKK